MGKRIHRFPNAAELLEHVEGSARNRRLFPEGEAILVAVSGGVDSMVLLDVLHRLAPRYGWRLTVAHFNHQLRGRSSDADERLVLRTAEERNLPAVVERADVRQFARRQGLSVEMGARRLRHKFLARAAAEGRCGCIALAHHADDQLELFFLRLLRGSGSEGLGGMRWSNPSPANSAIQLSRPLLDQPKGALCAYAEARKLRFREDATNALLDIQRNRIRHELLPLLRKGYQPALDRTVLRLMEMLASEAEVVKALAGEWLKAGAWRRTPFGRLPVAVQRRCLHLQLVQLGVSPEFELVERLRHKSRCPVCVALGKVVRDSEGMVQFQAVPARLEKPSSRSSRRKEAPLSGAFGAESEDQSLLASAATITKQAVRPLGFTSNALDLRLEGKAGEVEFDGARIGWKVNSTPRAAERARRVVGREVFDADRVGGQVRLRHWQPGDRFQPIGMGSAIKLQDFFTNEKVPRERRHELVVAEAANGEIFWVEGLRIGERFKLGPQTIRGLQWRWERP